MSHNSHLSIVRSLSVSRFCPNFPIYPLRYDIRRSCLSSVSILFACYVRISGVCLSGFFCLDCVSCPNSIRIFRKMLSGVFFRSCLSRFGPLTGFCLDLKKGLLADCLFSRTRTRQRCPDFRCSYPPTSDHHQNVLFIRHCFIRDRTHLK